MKNIIETILFSLLLAGFCNATEPGDSIQEGTSISTKKIMLLQTPWSFSENAASLSFFGYDQKIGSASVYSELQDKNYRLYREGDNIFKAGFVTDGFVQYKKWNFYGNFNYFSKKEDNVKWVGVMNPYDDNPYTIGDSIGGDYSKEYFNMEGKGAYLLSNLLTFGFDVKYSTGVGAKRKDPRPENTITSFDISPALLLSLNKIKLGANFRYVSSKEDIEISTITNNTFYTFHFKGLGVYTSTPEEDDQIFISNLLGGGLQFNFNGDKISNLTEVNFYKKSTDIKRGTTFPLQVVLLEKFNTSVNSTFIYSPSEKKINRLELFFTDKHNYGHEPVVEPKLEAVNYQWSTAAKYTLYWHKENEYGFNYSFFNLIDKNRFNWGATLAGRLNSSEITYYFVPEYNQQKLNIFNLDASIEKGFQYSSGDIVFALTSGYRKGFNSSLKFVEDESLLSTVQTEMVNHDFYYYNSGLMQFGASAKIGKNISIYHSPMQVFIDAGFKALFSNLADNPKSKILEIKLGMNF
ncbi:hypothetical protein OU798_02325 [Prolixibacteraceae bacterium Z1-6]|uniref:DUF6850 domain-containing protein n=1 Tax=Draconibacterium aestuarii TaxID=2998507 RepID=A0A9X3J4B4_9BACT|nr:hypothetical protein [Prolixibacteraceae bacterium Z1-6]